MKLHKLKLDRILYNIVNVIHHTSLTLFLILVWKVLTEISKLALCEEHSVDKDVSYSVHTSSPSTDMSWTGYSVLYPLCIFVVSSQNVNVFVVHFITQNNFCDKFN